jgi:hypothetical protein
MFDPVLESLRKATEMSIQIQQEMFKKWVELWPMPMASPMTSAANWPERVRDFQKKWADLIAEALKKQREVLETQFSAGMKNIEAAFAIAEAKDAGELRSKATELWQKTFDCLKQTFEAQVQNQQALISKWTELMLKNAA